MKHLLPLAACVLSTLAFSACERKPQTAGEKIEDKVNDALDRRPNEKAKDTAEDLKADAKDLGHDLKQAGKDAKDELKSDAHEAKQNLKGASEDAKEDLRR